MSYFTLNSDNQNLINMKKMKITDRNVIQPMRKRNHQGVNNPHYGHKQSEESKRRISESQKMRYRNTITEDKVRTICNEVIEEYLNRNVKPLNIK